MLLIADTSPIISLIYIGQLDLISKLYPNFVIPKAVLDELTSHLEINVYIKELSLLQKHAHKISGKTKISDELGKGETEAILLYQQLHADLLLIDDKKARMIAEAYNIHCIGTLGLMYKAKNSGLITELKPLFRELVAKKRYYSEPPC